MLDKKSLKILKILQEKARIPNTEVARQVGLAPSAVLERIRKMETQGFIDGYEVRLNPERFSRNQVAFVTIEPDNTADADDEIGEKLSSIEEIQEVHYIAGEDSYLIKLRVADTKELGVFLRQVIHPLQGVRSTRTSTVLKTYKETARISIR
ncbi:MAG: Lrp/AsnC family transcriptional regulator [Desulfopila sp.]|jgi:Lrp/AsnC family leucine-responsive transcriptional regulator|nr:Lrp/AsnC family transcriptional regulator [Desulfopila sp.]